MFSDILRERAEHAPDGLAYRMLADEGTATEWTWRVLRDRVWAVAERLAAEGARGERVLLLSPPGLDYIAGFYACLCAGAVAVPAYPPANVRRLPRIVAIRRDAAARFVLSTSRAGAAVRQMYEASGGEPAPRFLFTDDLAAGGAWEPPEVDVEDLALLQYTSGTTGTPKGIMVTHRNLLANSELLCRAFGYSDETRCFSWLPPYHDMGLIGGILQPLYGGFSCTLMAPAAFLQAPVRWLREISLYGITLSGGPNFAYELCARRASAEDKRDLDLSRWTVAFNGAEPVRASTLDRFAREFRECGFRPEAFLPCYGLAEATLFVCGAAPGSGPRQTSVETAALARDEVALTSAGARSTVLVGCGGALPPSVVAIVSPENGRPTDGVGEIWVASESCARGYWNRPAETAETFGARLPDGAGPFLRTGDLGFLREGQLHVAGRRKDVIIIRGLNHHPEDIETSVEEAEKRVRPGGGAAFSVEESDGERLAVAYEFDGDEAAAAEVMAAIVAAVAERHELQVDSVLLLRAGSIPRTSSGKVQRHACRAALAAGELRIRAAWHRNSRPEAGAAEEAFDTLAGCEEWLRRTVAEIAKVELASVRPERSITAYGFDSLGAVELAQRAERVAGCSEGPHVFLAPVTIRELAERLWRSAKEVRPALARTTVPEAGVHPLSWGQRALWFVHQLTPEDAGLNVSTAFRVRGGLDLSRFQRAVAQLAERHSALRTTFDESGGEPRQTVHPRLELPVEARSAEGWPERELRAAMTRTAYARFALDREGPARVGVWTRGPDECHVVISVHHLVADYISMMVLVDELEQLYVAGAEGRPLPPARSSIAFVAREESFLATDEGRRSAEYWDAFLKAAPRDLDLPLDEPRRTRRYEGRSCPFQVPAALSERAKRFAQDNDVTLHAVLLAAFSAVLSAYSGQDDFCICSPVAVRNGAELARTVGYLVNPALVRARMSAAPSFRDLVRQLHTSQLAALEAAPFPLARWFAAGGEGGGRGFSARAMFTLYTGLAGAKADLAGLALGEAGTTFDFAGLACESERLERRMSQFDLALVMAASGGVLRGALEYDHDTIDARTAEALVSALLGVLEAALASPHQAVRDLTRPSSAERRRLLAANPAAVDFGRSQLLHRLIEEQAGQTPEAVAVRSESRRLSYRELNAHADRLAAALRTRIGVGDPVAVYMDRCLELPVALLGILKAGAAFLPLSPDHPPARLEQLLADCGAAVVVTAGDSPAGALDVPSLAVSLDSVVGEMGTPAADLPGSAPAYVIYTSGSTGKPKGAVNSHAAICNRLLWMQGEYRLDASDRVLQKTPATFDVSVWEFFWPLLAGAALVMAPPGLHKDPAGLARFIQEHGITTLHFVPSMLQQFLDEPSASSCTTLRRVICSGEALSFALQEQCLATLPAARLSNLYGPTEAAVDVTFWHCQPEGRSRVVPIGRPIANLRTYVLDADGQPVPWGARGELYLAGAGVGLGYLRRPALTADRFRPDPFADAPGERMYRTGDVTRFRMDGSVEYLGRTDHQVKVRGCRVELGEVEAVLSEHPAVREVAVVSRRRPDGDPFLAAYVVIGGEPAVPLSELRDFVRRLLPDHMVPAAFLALPALPLNANGKVDRAALPEPGAALAPGFVAPETPIERELCQLWSELLHVPRVGVTDEFYEMGGHSLILTRLAAALRERFHVNVPLRRLMDATTVPAMADLILVLQLEADPRADIDELLRSDGDLPLGA